MIWSGGFKRSPWLSIHVRDRVDGGGLEAVLVCERCAGTVTVPIDPHEHYLKAAANLEHHDGCPVPVALARAAAAQTN